MMTTLASLLLMAALIILLALICHQRQTRQHQQRLQQGIVIACDLLALTKTVQQHRGVSSAILGGKQDQSQQIRQLGEQVENGFAELHQHLPDTEQGRLNHIHAHWQQLHRLWADSEVLANFERHCDIIRQLQSLMQDLTDMCGLTSSEYTEHRQLAGQIFSKLPSVIENLGQLRALSTHAAVRHTCITAFRLHLQYLLEQLKRQTEDLQKQRSNQSRIDQISGLTALINKEILTSEAISIDPEHLFRSVTQVMENCYSDIDTGVKQLAVK